MPPRAWQILPAVALAALSSLTFAAEKEKPEWQRRLDAMKLPPDPKFEVPLARAHARINACFDEAALKAIAVGKAAKDITEPACKACDRQIMEYGALFAQANQHRFIGITAEQATESERSSCAIMKSLRVTSIRDKFNEEVVQRAAYATFGEWSVEGRTHRSGLLTYALMGRGDNPKIALEMVCTPATKHVRDLIVGPFKGKTESVYVTYVADAGPMKQTAGSQQDGAVGLSGQNRGADLLAMTFSAESVLRISVAGISAKFEMAGFRQIFKDWSSRCF